MLFVVLIILVFAQCCYLCGEQLQNTSTPVLIYLKHMAKHRNANSVKFCCFYSNCSRAYSSYAALYTHCKRNHYLNEAIQSQPQQDRRKRVVLNCTLEWCGKKCIDYKSLIKHLKSHIRENIEIECPFPNCSSAYNKVSSFSSHLTRMHKVHLRARQEVVHHVSRSLLQDAELGDNINLDAENAAIVNDIEYINDSHAKDVFETGELEGNDDLNAVDLNPFAMFLLKLESKLLVPQSTIQAIFDEIMCISEAADNCLKSQLVKKLEIAESKLNNFNVVFENYSLSVTLHRNRRTLGTTYSRKVYFKQDFNYVPPVEIYLGRENSTGTRFCYHYIPITQLLKVFLSNFKNLFSQTTTSTTSRNNNVLYDFWDGSLYKHMTAFDSLSIFLYQDAFLMVNPLGSSTKKHKLLGVYLVVGNLPSSICMSLDNILVMLVRESYLKRFGQSIVFRRLISDLKQLCSDGIFCNGRMVKVNLLGILGDNLGAHYIGGFSENFNTVNFCRFCLIEKVQFENQPYTVGETSTKEKYDESVKMLQLNMSLKQHMGIKFASPFHQLQQFHVCSPALLPCIGHDLFEGIVAYDMALFIKHFVRLHWFTYDKLNNRILKFKYTAFDVTNKPPTLPFNANKLPGQAAKNWCFLRLLLCLLMAWYVILKTRSGNCI